ncbi:MAG: nickel-dependent lactate racemase [Clostridia bacterium]|nr:nickel-dependent lactate racemase [Clostridia bacterium]
MQVALSYGKTGLPVELPEDNLTVVEPVFVPGLDDEQGAIAEALNHPLGCPALKDTVRPSDTVAVVFCDATRPVPNRRILPAILGELERVGVKRDQIVLINALGTHRPSPPQELVELLGEDLVREYRVVQHDCCDRQTMALAGRLSTGQEFWVNRDYMSADFKILTGFIEPHFFAGFSGGGKLVFPGIASLENIKEAHGYRILSHDRSTWGNTRGNPVWELLTEGAQLTAPDFIVNVTLNSEKAITGVFAGELRTAHAQGAEHAKRTAMRAVSERFDVVITTNSGYPLDRNVYQTVKGISAAAGIVKKGGAIIAAAECIDGIPAGSHYHQLLERAGTPERALGLIANPGFSMQDQWQVQLQAEIQMRADVYLYSHRLSPDEIRTTMLKPCQQIEDTLADLLRVYGQDASICVLPEGPQTIPYVDSAADPDDIEC